MYSMSWEEAQKAMSEGKTVMHEYFTPDEFFRIRNGQLVDEADLPMDRWYCGEDWQKKGWRLSDDTDK